MLEIRDWPSPNHDARPPGTPIDILLLHYTGMPTGEAALARLTDAEAKVSAHYLVAEDGSVFRLVAEARRAWHAGVSSWAGDNDINARSVGIEIVNPGHEFGYRAFPEAQMAALLALAQDIVKRHAIAAERVLGHSDVAPARKEDPGELFDWPRLAAAGVGLWPEAPVAIDTNRADLGAGSADQDVHRLQVDLERFGYALDVDGRYDQQTEFVVRAFQRHWRPAALTGVADAETRAVLSALLDQIGARA